MSGPNVTEILRGMRLCGTLSHDGKQACILGQDHSGRHGWEDTLNELEAIALATTSHWELGDEIPQDTWDELHRRGFLFTSQDWTGDYTTRITDSGVEAMYKHIRSRTL